MLKMHIRLFVIAAALLAAAGSEAQERPDPMTQTVVQAVQTTGAAAQMLLDAYNKQRADLASQKVQLDWYESYFRGLSSPQPAQ